MIVLDSDSRLPLLSKCAGSASLPHSYHDRAPNADVGSAMHEHLEWRVKYGWEAAFNAIDQIADKWHLVDALRDIFRARCFGFVWKAPEGAIAEQALAWFDGGTRVDRLEGGRGEYRHQQPFFGPGTIDVLWSEPDRLIVDGSRVICPRDSVLWVVDYKAGDDAWVDPVERNAQIASGAVKAAKWTGAKSVMPAIVYVRKGEGVWDCPDKPWGAYQLDLAKDRLWAIYDQIRDQAANPTHVRYVDGAHCRWCEAQAACPAVNRQLREVLSTAPGPLSAEDAPRLARLLPQVRGLAERIEAALRAAVAERGAIPLGDGTFWGPRDQDQDRILAAVALPIIEQEIGRDAAMGACTISKAALRESVAGCVPRGQAAATMRRLFAAIGADGGMLRETVKRWQVYRAEDKETP